MNNETENDRQDIECNPIKDTETDAEELSKTPKHQYGIKNFFKTNAAEDLLFEAIKLPAVFS